MGYAFTAAAHLFRRCKTHHRPIALTVAFGIAALVLIGTLQHEPNGRRLRFSTAGQQNNSLHANPAAAPLTLPALPSTEYYISWLNEGSTRRNDSFDPQINATELRVMLNLLWTFLDLCEQHGIQTILYGGTLLGSYRHHGVMPWDDDVDLLVKNSDQDALESAIKRKYPELQLTKPNRWKVWNKTACLHQAYSWCWPYIDLSFYKVLEDKILDTVPAYGKNYTYSLQHTFPLHKRPFMGRWVDAPSDTLRFLGYDKSPTGDCISLYYSHKLEDSPPSEVLTLDCAMLTATYPFVIRVPNVAGNGGGILEALRFYSGKPAYTVRVEEPEGSFNYDYSFVPID